MFFIEITLVKGVALKHTIKVIQQIAESDIITLIIISSSLVIAAFNHKN